MMTIFEFNRMSLGLLAGVCNAMMCYFITQINSSYLCYYSRERISGQQSLTATHPSVTTLSL